MKLGDSVLSASTKDARDGAVGSCQGVVWETSTNDLSAVATMT